MKIFKGIFFGAILFSTTLMAQLQPVQYKDGSQILNGLSIKPNKSSAQKPGVLVLPAWKGIDAHAKSTAENLSKLGYYAFVADIYGEGNYPQTTADAAKMAGFYKKNTELYHKRIELALAQLIQSGANPDNIAVIGFCFGGTGAIEAARANMNVKGVVSFHGGLGKDANRAVTSITAKVLACHGADDPFNFFINANILLNMFILAGSISLIFSTILIISHRRGNESRNILIAWSIRISNIS